MTFKRAATIVFSIVVFCSFTRMKAGCLKELYRHVQQKRAARRAHDAANKQWLREIAGFQIAQTEESINKLRAEANECKENG